MQALNAGSAASRKPRFSIVIPTYNRPESLRNCLSGIAAMTSEKSDFEVIVVDDCSDCDVTPVIDMFKTDIDLYLLHHGENRGPASARNYGAYQARGEYLLFLDDDCVPCRDWLVSFGRRLENRLSTAVGGSSRNGLSRSFFSEAQQMLLDYLYDYYNKDPDNARFCATNNLAVPRSEFLRTNGFDTSFRWAAGEDREFCERWLRSGATLFFIAEAPVYHQHAMGLVEFLKLHFRYGRGAKRLRVRAASAGIKRGFESLKFYRHLIVFPFSRTGVLRAFIISSLQVLSQLAHTAGYFRELLSTR